MIEVLVTLIIVVLGLLGLLGMQARGQQATLESYQRAQALILLADMADRLKANRKTAPCYEITTGAGSPYFGTGYSGTPACVGYGDPSTQVLAVNGMNAWNDALKGAAEKSAGASVGAMVGARGCITYDPANGTFIVAVAWQGFSDTIAPVVPAGATAATANAIACGTGLYDVETKRRVVWTPIRIATLT